jgi:hypothetical protein
LHVAAPSQESQNQFLITTKTQTTIASPEILASMTFSANTMERERVPHDINSHHSFEALPLKPNSQRNIWVCMTESHPIQQFAGINRPVEFADETFRHMIMQPDR